MPFYIHLLPGHTGHIQEQNWSLFLSVWIYLEHSAWGTVVSEKNTSINLEHYWENVLQSKSN